MGKADDADASSQKEENKEPRAPSPAEMSLKSASKAEEVDDAASVVSKKSCRSVASQKSQKEENKEPRAPSPAVSLKSASKGEEVDDAASVASKKSCRSVTSQKSRGPRTSKCDDADASSQKKEQRAPSPAEMSVKSSAS